MKVRYFHRWAVGGGGGGRGMSEEMEEKEFWMERSKV